MCATIMGCLIATAPASTGPLASVGRSAGRPVGRPAVPRCTTVMLFTKPSFRLAPCLPFLRRPRSASLGIRKRIDHRPTTHPDGSILKVIQSVGVSG